MTEKLAFEITPYVQPTAEQGQQPDFWPDKGPSIVKAAMDGCKLIESRLDDACGCVEEEWDTPAGYMSVHITPEGHGDVFFDNGDAGVWEVQITGKDQTDFRRQLVSYIDSQPGLIE